MNIEEAREILSSSRRTDREDPTVLEAMKLAEDNPQLKEWVEVQEVMDPKISKALDEVEVPEALEQLLLSSVKGARKSKSNGIRWTIRAFGIAALLVIGIGVVFSFRNDSAIQKLQEKVRGESFEDFDDFRDGMAYFIAQMFFLLDYKTEDISSIENWLKDKDAPVYEGLPAALQALNPIGCKELAWKGNKVSLVCFHTKEGKIVHLFIMDREGVPEKWIDDISTVAYSKGLETGGWTSGNTVYLLVGSDPDVDIEFALI